MSAEGLPEEEEEEEFGPEELLDELRDLHESFTEEQQEDVFQVCFKLFHRNMADAVRLLDTEVLCGHGLPFEHFAALHEADPVSFEGSSAGSALAELTLMMRFMKENPKWRFQSVPAYRKFCVERKFPISDDVDEKLTEELRRRSTPDASFNPYVDPSFVLEVSKDVVAKEVGLLDVFTHALTPLEWRRVDQIARTGDCSRESLNWVREMAKTRTRDEADYERIREKRLNGPVSPQDDAWFKDQEKLRRNKRLKF